MKRLTFEQIKAKFNEFDYTLISTIYEGSQKPLSVICSQGHETTISWNNFQKGQRCKFCAGNVKYTIEEVKKIFADRNCELLEVIYLNNLKPLKYRCKCGKIGEMRLADFQRGRYCQHCKAKTLSEKMKTSDAEIALICEQHNCKFVRSWIKCKKTRIEYICKCGNQSEAYWTNFKNYPNCKKCGNKKVSGENCYMYDPDRDGVAFRKKFRKICNTMIRRFMKATNGVKSKKSAELLGYTPEDLQKHILSHPDYNSCKDEDWHVDHIFPIQAFVDHGILDLKVVNALNNLRPISSKENLSKADTYNEKEFKEWLKQF